jgi:hypothetical protein
VPLILQLIPFLALFWFAFGILGVGLFKGRFGYCTDLTVDSRAECHGTFEKVEHETVVAAERVWYRYEQNFDNIGFALLSTLFVWPPARARAPTVRKHPLGWRCGSPPFPITPPPR